MTVLGVILAAGLVGIAAYVALSLFVFWELFGFFLTTLRFSEGSRGQRSSFAISFIGGFLMLLTPVVVVLSHIQVFPPGWCSQWGFDVIYVCMGTPIVAYYSTINQMVLVGGVAVLGSLLYVVHARLWILSGVLLLSASVLFPMIVLPTQLPVFYVLVSLVTALGGLLVLIVGGTTRLHATQRFAGEIFRLLKRRMGIVVLLLVLFSGVVVGLGGYANETAESVGVICETGSEVLGFVHNETVGVANPFYLPLQAVWKVTYNYTIGLVYTDTESFHIPAHGTAYPRFSFASLELQKGVIVNSTYPLIFSYERIYRVLLWSFVQNGSDATSYGWGGKQFAIIVGSDVTSYGAPILGFPSC